MLLYNQGKAKIDFHSHFSDYYVQNASTTFEHMKTFIHLIYKNKFFIKDVIIYDTIDGSRKIYMYANEIRMIYVLLFTYIVMLDRCINATDNGIRNIYIISGYYKMYLGQKFAQKALNNVRTKV